MGVVASAAAAQSPFTAPVGVLPRAAQLAGRLSPWGRGRTERPTTKDSLSKSKSTDRAAVVLPRASGGERSVRKFDPGRPEGRAGTDAPSPDRIKRKKGVR